VESSGDAAKVAEFGRQVAMHVAATAPLATTSDEVDPDVVERERAVLVEQARESGKPDNIIEKMIGGRMNKFFQEVVFLEQTFVIDGETKVSKVIEKAAKDAGSDIKLTGYVRLELGEGIEKEVGDFAAEVAAAVSS